MVAWVFQPQTVETETGETGWVRFDEEVNVAWGLGQGLLGDVEDVWIYGGVDGWEHRSAFQVDDATLERAEGGLKVVRGGDEGRLLVSLIPLLNVEFLSSRVKEMPLGTALW